MSYVKAHPFGYKPVKNYTGKPAETPQDKGRKQTIVYEVEYKVMRRKKVWETDPVTGKKKMKLVPVTETKKVKGKTVEVPVYDTYKGVQTREVKHYGRAKKGRTLAEMVYESFPANKVQ